MLQVLHRLRKARLLWPTLAALAGLAVLMGLGTWQMERKRWKEELIANIAARVKAEPIKLFPDQEAIKDLIKRAPGDVIVLETKERQAILEHWFPEYTHVTVRGRFHHDKERYLYAPTTAGLGWHVYTPLETTLGGLVWVNRGLVPDLRKEPATRTKGQVAGEVEVRGLVRWPTGRGLFAANNDPTNNIWHWPDITAMTKSAFPAGLQGSAGGPRTDKMLPLVIEADARPAPLGGLPRGRVTRLELPNRHLEYALTWYGLGATLIGVYLAFAVSRLRASS